MEGRGVHSGAQLAAYVQQIGFLPLLDSGITGFSAEEVVDDDCRYIILPDGGWDWPLWKWKGSVITDGGCVYGKFFNRKAGFVSRQWWPDFFNYRRSKMQKPAEGSIEEAILQTLQVNGSMITRELRNECGFTGTGMRGRFDAYVTRLQMGCYIVIEDFVYPRDKYNNEYGWGWALLATPEQLYGHDACQCEHTPNESFQLIYEHFKNMLPHATHKQLLKMIG